MRLTVRFLGLDLIDLELTTDSSSPEPEDMSRDLSGGTSASFPVGFTAQPGDQRWEHSPDYE